MKEFKKFIARGNVMDMAVGTIIGASFTAIVTALSNGILKPFINTILYYCFGGDSDALNKIYTILVPSYKDVEGVKVLDLTTSIYIDWGAFISAIINFLLVAFVLFIIIRTFNHIKDKNEMMSNLETRIQFKQEKGYKLNKRERKYLKEKEEALRLKALEPKPEPVIPEDIKLLTEIRDLLSKSK